jgi:MFS family permease
LHTGPLARPGNVSGTHAIRQEPQGNRILPHQAALDWLNFLLADVRGGLGPYVSVFLLTQAHWDQATIGAVLTVSGIIGISMHTPVGALIDATQAKRGLIIAGAFALAACALAIAFAPTLPIVLAADIVMAVVGAIFAPTVSAITLGLVGREQLPARLARNVAFDRLGNLFIAAAAAAAGTAFSLRAVFYLVPFFAVLTTLAVLAIPARAIDHDRARGLDHDETLRKEHPSGWSILLTCKPLLILAAALALFHFANAPMLPLASQKLALAHPGREAALTSAAIVVAQFVMIPMALLAARANIVGSKPFLLIALAALPLRGALFSVSEAPAWILAVQVLDGVAGGLLEVLVPLMLADIMRGTGRYNVSRGFLGTVQGVGGSLSQAAAGYLVVTAGYDTAFLALAGVALIAFVLVLVAMPETGRGIRPQKIRWRDRKNRALRL